MKSTPILRKDNNGAIRTWHYEVNGNQWRTIAGGPGRKDVISGWTTCKGKQGRTDDQQALFEADAEERKKLSREYRRTEAELATVPLSPMLAKSWDDYKDKVQFPVFTQPKLDGIRALITRHGAFTREYQRHLNVDHILEALAPVFEDYPDLVLDGELYNHDLKADFGKICSIVRKQDPTDAQRAEARRLIQFHCYDVGDDSLVFDDRDTLLAQLFDEGFGPIVRVDTCEVTDRETLDKVYGDYLEQGYEGQMVRLNLPYEFDTRSKSLLKRKEFITEEFEIARIEEGQGNWAGYAKRVEFVIPWATPGNIAGGAICGAGIRGTQSQMKELLAKKLSPGDTVTVRYFTPTPDGMPRFPVAVDFHFGGGRVD